jgi:hypothetical protein
VIHDPLVIPVPLDPAGFPMSDIIATEVSILRTELRRAEIFPDAAENAVEVLGYLHDVRRLVASASGRQLALCAVSAEGIRADGGRRGSLTSGSNTPVQRGPRS